MPAWKRIQAVLFDWDGTLLNSYRADARAYQQMFAALGVPWGLAELDLHYSPDWYRVYRAAGIPRSRWPEADRLWRLYYSRQKPVMMPGARSVLRRLARSFRLALVTSGDRARVTQQLRHFGLGRIFRARVCSEDAPRRKPHPAPLRLALQQLNLAPAACVYVGDAPEDVEMAQRARVRAVGVLGPFPTHRRLRAARPEAVLESIAELPRWLRSVQPVQGAEGRGQGVFVSGSLNSE